MENVWIAEEWKIFEHEKKSKETERAWIKWIVFHDKLQVLLTTKSRSQARVYVEEKPFSQKF